MSKDISSRLLGTGSVGLTFTVVAEAHLCLAEANGVLALTNAIKLFEFFLVNALQSVSIQIRSQYFEPQSNLESQNFFSSYLRREVNLDGFDADIGWSR